MMEIKFSDKSLFGNFGVSPNEDKERSLSSFTGNDWGGSGADQTEQIARKVEWLRISEGNLFFSSNETFINRKASLDGDNPY